MSKKKFFEIVTVVGVVLVGLFGASASFELVAHAEVASAGTALPTGGYALMPQGMNHFAFTKTETTIVLFGLGPVGFTYINPADDPRKK